MDLNFDLRFIVKAWSSRSESSYVFGPFENEDAANAFMDKLCDDPKWTDLQSYVLNPPNSAFDGSAVG